MANSGPPQRFPITWKRAAAIFGNPKPPKVVWEKQFDDCDGELQRLARTSYDLINFSDLWYYHHDLAYVELQPDLFAYLLPACLMDWHQTLEQNKACSHGDSEFHYGLYQGQVLPKMTTPRQSEAIYLFFRDSFLDRLDAECDYAAKLEAAIAAHGWIFRFNSLGFVMPRIDLLWNSWWEFFTPGQAMAALQYCSGLMYCGGENPLFPQRLDERGGGGPYLAQHDASIYHGGWLPENLAFLNSVLTVEFIKDKVGEAASRLKHDWQMEWATQLAKDLPKSQELIEYRIEELLALLKKTGTGGWDW